eukprot:gene18252-20072_t
MALERDVFGAYWKHVALLFAVTSIFAVITIWQRLQLDECTENNDGLVLLHGQCSLVVCMLGKQRYFQIDEKRTKCDVTLPRPCPYNGDLYMPGQIMKQLKNKFLICLSGKNLRIVYLKKEFYLDDKQACTAFLHLKLEANFVDLSKYFRYFYAEMKDYFAFVLVVVAFGYSQAYRITNDLEKKVLDDVLQSTAKEAEMIGKQALKYFVPASIKSGMDVIKPFISKRHVKRSVDSTGTMQSGFYPWWYNNGNWMMNNMNSRSAISYPNNYNNWYLNGQYAAWHNNAKYWTQPYPRSAIPAPSYALYYPQAYYYPPSTYYPAAVETRTLHDDNAANKNEDKTSLNEFQDLISKVDSAFVSYSKDSGVTLNENLKGVESAPSEESTEQSQKRSNTPEERQKNGIKVITDTFTDFVCGDNC